MKTILLLLTVVLMYPLCSGEIIVEKITSEEWQIQLSQIPQMERSVKTLCIGNSEFQIRFPIIDTCKFVLKKQIALFNGKRVLSFAIKLETGEATFLLPVDNQYFIFEKMIIHPKKKECLGLKYNASDKSIYIFFGEN